MWDGTFLGQEMPVCVFVWKGSPNLIHKRDKLGWRGGLERKNATERIFVFASMTFWLITVGCNPEEYLIYPLDGESISIQRLQNRLFTQVF
jgi:hypothetical protein